MAVAAAATLAASALISAADTVSTDELSYPLLALLSLLRLRSDR